MIKPEIRIIAWDDCAFQFNDKRVLVVGVVFRGGSFIDGLLSTSIKKDGLNATEKVSKRILSSRHYDQLSLIMLKGISFGGLNIINIREMNKKTKLPIIVVIRSTPNLNKFKDAMKKLSNYKKRMKAVDDAGEIYKYKNIFYQKCGISSGQCEEIFRVTCTRSNIPEPLRVAHIIASGLSRKDIKQNDERGSLSGYESRGRA